MQFFMAIIALLLTAPAFSNAADSDTQTPAADAKTIRLLTVGNSFSRNACTYLPQIAASAGVEFIIGTANLGGCSLERHWKRAELNLQEPDNPDGKYGTPGKDDHKGLKEKLTEDKWDYITIQQFSYISHDPATYQPWADKLAAFIREQAPQAKLLVHQTWAYRKDSTRFTGEEKENEPTTQEQMYNMVRKAYYDLAKHLDAGLLPCGDAFFTADSDPERGYKKDEKFDFAGAVEPNLPDQTNSLHAGYRWKKNKEEQMVLGLDANHAGMAGNYLAGLVFFEVMSGISATEVSFVPEELDAEYAAYLRQLAHDTIAKLPANMAALQ